MFLPIDWEQKEGSGLKRTGREIRKISETKIYQNVCAVKPLKNGQIHRIKFKVIQYGTVAIGLLPSHRKYKNQKCVTVDKQ